MAKQPPAPVEPLPVTMNNTKKELLDAYEAAKALHEQAQQQLLTAEEARRKAEKLAAIKTAEAQTAGDPIRRLQDLRTDIGRELSDIAQRYETETAIFKRVQQAIEEKQAELKDLYGIESAAGDLAALISAQQARKTEFEAEMARQQAELDAEVSATRAGWADEKARRAAEVKEEEEELKKRRKREQEDYDYSLKREREQRRNAIEDERGALEKDLAVKREAFEAETAAKTKTLSEREQAVTTREAEFSQMSAKVQGFPNEIAGKVKEAVTQTTQRLTGDFDKARELMQARFEGEKNVFLGKTEALEALVAAQREQLLALAEKQEKAYEKVQDIATRAVAAAKREVIAIPSFSQGKGQSSLE